MAWAELADLYVTGKTPVAGAHSTLQRAAASWLDRAGEPTVPFLAEWVTRTFGLLKDLVARDGDFWRPPAWTFGPAGSRVLKRASSRRVAGSARGPVLRGSSSTNGEVLEGVIRGCSPDRLDRARFGQDETRVTAESRA